MLKDLHDCIEFCGARDQKGYGLISHEGRTRRAHRLAYETHIGPIPNGMQVLHSCDNPPCINPQHLFIGTNADNVKDRVRKGRSNTFRGFMHLTKEQVEEIKSLFQTRELTVEDIAVKFRVGRSTVYRAVTGKR